MLAPLQLPSVHHNNPSCDVVCTCC